MVRMFSNSDSMSESCLTRLRRSAFWALASASCCCIRVFSISKYSSRRSTSAADCPERLLERASGEAARGERALSGEVPASEAATRPLRMADMAAAPRRGGEL